MNLLLKGGIAVATTEAQKRARDKYNREKMKQKIVRFSPNEMDLYHHLEAQPSQMGYIKSLIRKDMEAQKKPSSEA